MGYHIRSLLDYSIARCIDRMCMYHNVTYKRDFMEKERRGKSDDKVK